MSGGIVERMGGRLDGENVEGWMKKKLGGEMAKKVNGVMDG